MELLNTRIRICFFVSIYLLASCELNDVLRGLYFKRKQRAHEREKERDDRDRKGGKQLTFYSLLCTLVPCI